MVQKYLKQFETLLSKTNRLPSDQLVAMFISGLKENIGVEVDVHTSESLIGATSLAKKYERRIQNQKKFGLSWERKKYAGSYGGESKETTDLGMMKNSKGEQDGQKNMKIQSVKKLRFFEITGEKI